MSIACTYAEFLMLYMYWYSHCTVLRLSGTAETSAKCQSGVEAGSTFRLVMPMSSMLSRLSTPSIFVSSWLTSVSCTPAVCSVHIYKTGSTGAIPGKHASC